MDSHSQNSKLISICLLGVVGWFCYTLYVYIQFHEVWRDEAQAYLIASGFKDFKDLIEIMRFDGHPPLWHLVIWFFYELGLAQKALMAALVVGQLVLFTGTFYWTNSLTDKPNLSMLLLLLLVPTYTYSYEYGMVARSYALGMGLCFFCAGFSVKYFNTKEYRYYFATLACATLAILTVVHSAILSCAILTSLHLHILFHKELTKKIIASLSIPLIGIVILLDIIRDNPERSYGPSSVSSEHLLRPFGDYLSELLFFVPKYLLQKADTIINSNNWWEHISILSTQHTAIVLILLFTLSIFIWGGTIICKVLTKRHTSFHVIFIILNTFVLGFLLIKIINSGYRHYLFVALPYFVFIAILSINCVFNKQSHVLFRSLGGAFLILSLTPQWIGSYQAYQSEIRYPFSQAQQLASLITDGASVFTDNPAGITSVIYYAPNHIYTSGLAKGRNFTYTLWDLALHKPHSRSSKLIELCKTDPVNLVMTKLPEKNYFKACSTLVWEYDKNIIDGNFSENFALYNFNCSCFLDLPEIRQITKQ